MAKKTATSKKKRTRSSQRKSSGEPADAAEGAERAEAGNVAAAVAVKDAATTAKPRRKRTKRTGRQKVAESQTTSSGSTSAAVTPAQEARTGISGRSTAPPTTDTLPLPDRKPVASPAQVEKSDRGIVIRFPPVAPLPFAQEAPVEAPPPQDSPARAPLTPAVAEPEEVSAPAELPAAPVHPATEPRADRKRRRRRRKKDAPPAGPAAPPPETLKETATEPRMEVEPVEAAPAAAAADATMLSPSKKRRLRRKRRLQTEQPAAAPAAQAESRAPATVEEPESSAPEEEEEVEEEDAPAPQPTANEAEAAPAPSRRRRRRGGRARRSADKEPEPDEKPDSQATPQTATKEMIINVVPGEECRIAILHRGQLEEMYIERASAENHVGNIYKGVVTNVEPSIQAAFVDFGLGKNGFLHVSDLHPQYFPDGGAPAETVGRKMPRRSRPPIQRCLRRSQHIIVQITKEGIGTKGPTLSTYLSIPGRFLVMMPGMRQLGVSRRIEEDELRTKLRKQLAELELPAGMGFIARTAAQDRTKRELQSDLKYLTRLWNTVNKRMEKERAPAELYRESDLVIRTIRDLYSPEIGRIMVDEPSVAQRAREFLRIFSPRSGDVVREYEQPEPIFHRAGIEAELDRLHSRHVPLKSGGSLVIDPTEALVAIDVNSGRFRTEDDAETTAYKINLEATDEIARQLRLRDLGGVIIIDFIDMRQESHKRSIERRLTRNLREHKERAKILRTSAFGIIEMTRQRQRASLTRSVYQDCRHCRGTGLVKTSESVALDVMRFIQLNILREQVRLIELVVSNEVAMLLLNRKRGSLGDLEKKYRRTVSIRPDPNFGLDHVEVRCYDHRGRPVPQA